MTSKIVVNNIEADAGVSTVTVIGDCQATTFKGDGSNLTSLPAQATLSNNGNDRIITGGSGVNLNGEANLQFDGTNLFMPNELRHLGDPDTKIGFDTDTIKLETGGSERVRIDSSGSLLVANTNGSRTNLSGNADDIVIGNTSTSNETGITLFSTSATSLRFNDAAGTDGAIEYGHSGRSMSFSAANANKMKIEGPSGGAAAKVAIGALANSAYLNTSTDGDRSTLKVGNYLHMDSGGNGNFTAGMSYNCWPQGQANFYQGTVTASGGDNRATAIGMRFGATTIYGDNSSTGYTSGQQITTMQSNMTVTRQGYVLKPNNPVFDAVRTSNLSGNGLEIAFNSVMTNIGSHYNGGNGRFTAPVAGTYFFSMFGMWNSSLAWYNFRKNGITISPAHGTYQTNGSDWSSVGMSICITLAVNDTIAVFLGPTGTGIYGSGNNHNGFCGYLIG